jgi:hypothetical protein
MFQFFDGGAVDDLQRPLFLWETNDPGTKVRESPSRFLNALSDAEPGPDTIAGRRLTMVYDVPGRFATEQTTTLAQGDCNRTIPYLSPDHFDAIST